jgi:hypothetical protein
LGQFLGVGTWTPWDARAAWRAAAIAAMAFVVAWLVTAATDEGGVAWGVRAGRALPLAPACAAIGTWLALASPRARGEDRALAALGRSPWQRAAAAVGGGAAIALVASTVIAGVPRVDVTGFYPRVERELRWRFDAGTFASDDGTWSIAPDGAPTHADPPPAPAGSAADSSAIPRRGRGAAALATALAGIALPMLIARTRRRTLPFAAIALGATSFLTILAFQAAAGARIPAFGVTLPPFVLLVLAAASYGSWPWQTARSQK